MLTPPTRRRAAFTLLELVIVLMIVAALAGLVIAQVAQLGRTSDMAYTAKTQADVAENLQLHFVLQKRYPTHMDSLLLDDDQDGTPEGVYLPVDVDGDGQQDYGLPDSGPHLDEVLVLGTLTDGSVDPASNQWRSLTRCGFDTVMDHTSAVRPASNSGVVPRSLGSGIRNAAIVDPSPANSRAQNFLAQLFPTSFNDNGTPADTSDDIYFAPDGAVIVALAVGPSSSCIPDTMLNAPQYPGNDGTYYGHYVALFACYPSGERANLIGVCDAYGRLPVYSIQQFNESLPNNQRRG